MLNIKKIKKQTINNFKKINKYKEYKKFFNDKNFRFVFEKLFSIFSNNENGLDIINQISINLIQDIENQNLWIDSMLKTSTFFDEKFSKVDWKSFGSFLFYTYNVSEFYNKKSAIKNVYTYENFNEINIIKTSFYNNWITSLYDLKIIDFNKYVIKVLKVVK